MQLTNFERLVIADLVTGDNEAATLIKQLEVATVRERDSTGCGVFVHLTVPDSVLKVQVDRSNPIEGDPRPFLRHPEVESGAMALLWLTDGVIDSLEMCIFGDEHWPSEDTRFELSHEWPKGYF